MTEAVTPPNPANPSDRERSVPDPTLLTIDALRREIAMLESLLSAKLGALESVMLERIKRLDALMVRSEEMRKEQKGDTRSAVDAALQAQERATHKMEKAVSEQIASLRNNLDATHVGLRSNIADLKDRLTVLESVKVGQSEQRTETRSASNTTMAVIGTVLTAILVALGIITGLAMGT